MDYLLTMTTNGRRDCFLETLDSFFRHVSPLPKSLFVYDDGRKTGVAKLLREGTLDVPVPVEVAPRRRHRPAGFCRATAACWEAAAGSGVPWFFHLEDDFAFARHLDLADLAHVLALEPHVAQMALMRNAVNAEEKAAGGLFELRRGEYDLRGAGGQFPWLEHRVYFTTNPSLNRSSIARSFAWPTEPECEGLYGFRMLQAVPGTTFGAWGVGTAWVRHFGERAGFGY